jgi:hypothetical protein
MPFHANWLEELVAEWLDLAGFATATGIFVPAGPGGRWSPDVVGAKLGDRGRLLIRHCEATMGLAQGAQQVKKKFEEKFQAKVQDAVRGYFACVFGRDAVFGSDAAEAAKYEKWVITSWPVSQAVRTALTEAVEGIEIHELKDFVLKEVLGSIEQFQEHHKKTTQLPGDRWLLGLIHHFKRCGLIVTPHGQGTISDPGGVNGT